MPKCPICGSTAQPKLENLYFKDGEDCVERYKVFSCGCGEHFKVLEVFDRTGIMIIEKM